MTSMFHILLIDSNFQSSSTIQQVLENGAYSKSVKSSDSLSKATSHLTKEVQYGSEQYPDLILLNLYDEDLQEGLQFTQELKNYECLKRIPIVIFLNPETTTDIDTLYNVHANCIINRPSDIYGWQRIIQVIENFWCNIVQLSPKIDYTYQH